MNKSWEVTTETTQCPLCNIRKTKVNLLISDKAKHRLQIPVLALISDQLNYSPWSHIYHEKHVLIIQNLVLALSSHDMPLYPTLTEPTFSC